MLNHDQLLNLIKDHMEHPATPREMQQRLKIPREQRSTLSRLLKDLTRRGDLVETRGNRYGLPDRMNLVIGRITINPRGFGFVAADRGAGPRDRVGDLYIAGNNLNQAMHGDRVVARIERVGSDGRSEGRILRILQRASETIVGRFEVDESGYRHVVPFDRRVVMDIGIPANDAAEASPGEMVVVEITRWPTPTRGPLGRVTTVLGDINEPGVDTEIIIRKHNIPDQHGPEAVDEATKLGTVVRQRDLEGRTDFRLLTTV